MFKCKNPNCERFDIETVVDTITWPYKVEEEREKDKLCKVCGLMMEYQFEESTNKSPVQLKFKSMSDADKKQVLKKRAQSHMAKNNFNETKLRKRAEAVAKNMNYGKNK